MLDFIGVLIKKMLKCKFNLLRYVAKSWFISYLSACKVWSRFDLSEQVLYAFSSIRAAPRKRIHNQFVIRQVDEKVKHQEFMIFDALFMICTISDAKFRIFDAFFQIFMISDAKFLMFDAKFWIFDAFYGIFTDNSNTY